MKRSTFIAIGCVAAVCSAFVTGCDVQKIANMTGGDGTALTGNNSAIGGVNFDTSHGKSSGWDRHIDSCRYSVGDLQLLSGGKVILDVIGDGAERKIAAHVPRGDLQFQQRTVTEPV